MPADSPPLPPPVSLLLRTLFTPPTGGGGAKLLDAFIPGIGGAPPTGGPESDFLSIIGADRSLVTAFLSGLPFEISDSRAPYHKA